jgi:hypothetical protein
MLLPTYHLGCCLHGNALLKVLQHLLALMELHATCVDARACAGPAAGHNQQKEQNQFDGVHGTQPTRTWGCVSRLKDIRMRQAQGPKGHVLWIAYCNQDG